MKYLVPIIMVFCVYLFNHTVEDCVEYRCPSLACNRTTFTEIQCESCFESVREHGAEKYKYEDNRCYVRMSEEDRCKCYEKVRELFKGCIGRVQDNYYILNRNCWARFRRE